MRKIIFILLLIPAVLYPQSKGWWDWYSPSKNIVSFPNLSVDTIPPISAYDTTNSCAYFTTTGMAYLDGTLEVTRPLELNWASTSNFTIDVWFRPTKATGYILMGKHLGGTYGWFIRKDVDAVGGKDITLKLVGLATPILTCYITDTTIFHHVKIVFTKSDSTIKTYHGALGTPDTLTYTYTACVWNSNFHAAVNYAFALGRYQLLNPDGSGTVETGTPSLNYQGYYKTLYIQVNDTNYFWDFRPYFSDVIIDTATADVFERQGVGAPHLWNGNTKSMSRDDISWVAGTRIYPTMLWDTTRFYPGIQDLAYKTIDSNLFESYGISLDTITWNGKKMLIWGGKGDMANGRTWDARLYNRLSPHIMVWNPDSAKWLSMGKGFNGAIVVDIIHHKGIEYAVGDFTYTYADINTLALGDTCNYIAQYSLDTGTTWRQVLGGLNNQGAVLDIFQDTLVIGGSFTTANGMSAKRIVKWDGTKYDSLLGGVNDNVWALEVYDSKLVVGGDFTDKGTRIATWDGSAWANPFGSGANGTIYVLKKCDYNNTLWAGGAFTIDGSYGIAYWDGSAWHGIGTGITGFSWGNSVSTIEFYSYLCFFGGTFRYVNGHFAQNVACIDLRTMTIHNIGTIDLRLEELKIDINPVNSHPYLITNGDGYTVMSDGFRFGTVISLDLTKLGMQ